MAPYLPVFVSPQAEAETMAAYRSVLNCWPVPYEELFVPTSLGETHVIACGPPGAPAVVLLHAFFASAVAWYPTAGALSSRYRVYAVDIIGEPNPSRPARMIKTMPELAQWFKELVDGLGIGSLSLVGNSFGAFLCAYFAMQMPAQIQKIVLISPAATFRAILPFYWRCILPKFVFMFLPRAPGVKRWLLSSVDWIRNGAPLDPGWEVLFRLMMLYGTGARMLFPRVYSPEELRQIKAPALLLIGDKEVIYRPQDTFQIARRWLPNLQTALLPNANHIAALSQPELVNRKIIDFLP